MLFKTLIAPLQSWLLSQGRCVGCGKNLSSGEGKLVTCACGRVYVFDSKAKTYRRALLEEVRSEK